MPIESRFHYHKFYFFCCKYNGKTKSNLIRSVHRKRLNPIVKGSIRYESEA